MRCLEIGPGSKKKNRVPNFETFNLGEGLRSDGGDSNYVGDARNLSMISDNTFDCVFSSHCIEHIHWYQVEKTIAEWSRVVKPGGTLEVWCPDGLAVIEEILRFEKTGKTNNQLDMKWRSDLTNGDPYLWLVGKLYNYCINPEDDFDHHLHRSLITPRFLMSCFEKAGLKNVRRMTIEEYRIPNKTHHGWINMGVCGTK